MKPDHNMHPHAEAILATTLWGLEYSHQRGGCMDFWNGLSQGRQRLVRETLDRIQALPRAPTSQETPA
jgi:hypothetical protein